MTYAIQNIDEAPRTLNMNVLRIIGELASPLEVLLAQLVSQSSTLESDHILAVVLAITPTIDNDRQIPDWNKRENIVAGLRIAIARSMNGLSIFINRKEERDFASNLVAAIVEYARYVEVAKSS